MSQMQIFMRGRYGADQLTVALLITGFLLALAGRISHFFFLSFFGYVLLGFGIFRVFSRNRNRRLSENQRFLSYYHPLSQKIRWVFLRSRTHQTFRYFSCPHCEQKMRAPRGKGKILIHCPRCKNSFYKST